MAKQMKLSKRIKKEYKEYLEFLEWCEDAGEFGISKKEVYEHGFHNGLDQMVQVMLEDGYSPKMVYDIMCKIDPQGVSYAHMLAANAFCESDEVLL